MILKCKCGYVREYFGTAGPIDYKCPRCGERMKGVNNE